jgi:hypothetical protein
MMPEVNGFDVKDTLDPERFTRRAVSGRQAAV